MTLPIHETDSPRSISEVAIVVQLFGEESLCELLKPHSGRAISERCIVVGLLSL